MQTSRRSWQQVMYQPGWRSVIGTVVIWFLLVFSEFLGLTQPLSGLIQKLFNPLEHGTAQLLLQIKIGLWQIPEAWQAEQALVGLRQERAQLLAEVIRLQSIEAENKSLRQMLQNSDRTLTKSIITAPIISFAQPALAVGSQAGVQPGMMVLANEELLGFVTEVGANQAAVTLLSQATTQPVLAQTEAGVTGLVRGNDHQLALTEVPPDVTVKVGEKVSTVGQAGVSPRLFIGTVSKVETPPAAATQIIWLQQPTSFFGVAVVEVR